jgi:hypothetical protein
MVDRLDLEGWWPELFEGLDAGQRWSVVQAFAANWHEGWQPNREDVELLTDKVKGLIDGDEYMRRVRRLAEDRALQRAVS